MTKRRVYEEIRGLVKSLKGKMNFERAGYQWGAWIIRLNGKRRIFRSNGSGYPELDKLYQPKPDVREPKHWKDYINTLRPAAQEKLLDLLSNLDND